MNDYRPEPSGKPDVVTYGIPFIRPDMEKMIALTRRHSDGTTERLVQICLFNHLIHPQHGEVAYNLCSQMIIPKELALLMAKDLMLNALFFEAGALKAFTLLSDKIGAASLALSKELDIVLGEINQQDNDAMEVTAQQEKERGQDKEKQGADSSVGSDEIAATEEEKNSHTESVGGVE